MILRELVSLFDGNSRMDDGYYLTHPGWLAPISTTAKRAVAKLLRCVCPSFSPHALAEAASSADTSHGSHPCQVHEEARTGWVLPCPCWHMPEQVGTVPHKPLHVPAGELAASVWLKQTGLCGYRSQQQILPPAFEEQDRDMCFTLMKFALNGIWGSGQNRQLGD